VHIDGKMIDITSLDRDNQILFRLINQSSAPSQGSNKKMKVNLDQEAADDLRELV
jgi:hypothetical protein